jgi:hypothetical protein
MDFILILAGFAGGAVWSAWCNRGASFKAALKRIVPLGGGGPDPVDPRQ